MSQPLRQVALTWYKSEGSFRGNPTNEVIRSGFLYNVFPPITDYNILLDGGYVTRLVYLKNEHNFPIAHLRLWFAYPSDETYGDYRGTNENIREHLLVGRQIDREVPPKNAPPTENRLPTGIELYKIPLDGRAFNNYDEGLELGTLNPNEVLPVWLVLSIPPLVQPVIVSFIRIIAEGVLVTHE